MSVPTTRTELHAAESGGIRGGHPAVRHAVESMLLEERTRWAMQIHDGLTQSVTSAVLELQTLRRRIATDPHGASETLKEIEDEIRRDLTRIRDLLFEMTASLPRSAEPTLAALVLDSMERWRLETSLEVLGDLEAMPEPVLEATYAIVTESLANAAKHSGSSVTQVRVHVEPTQVRVEVEDQGNGVASVEDSDRHFGSQIMKTRAEALGGSLDIRSTPGRGTTVVAVLPVGGKGEEI